MLTNHFATLDKGYKRVNIFINDLNEYVLRCHINGSHVQEWNYHALTELDALNEANRFLG